MNRYRHSAWGPPSSPTPPGKPNAATRAIKANVGGFRNYRRLINFVVSLAALWKACGMSMKSGDAVVAHACRQSPVFIGVTSFLVALNFRGASARWRPGILDVGWAYEERGGAGGALEAESENMLYLISKSKAENSIIIASCNVISYSGVFTIPIYRRLDNAYWAISQSIFIDVTRAFCER